MTAPEIAELLRTMADAIATGYDLFPAEWVAGLHTFLGNLGPEAVPVIARLRGESTEVCRRKCERFLHVLSGLLQFFRTGQWEETAGFLQGMASRKVLLRLIALHMRIAGDAEAGEDEGAENV